MRLISSILTIWFLVIQTYNSDAKAIAAIPMENQTYCEMAIANIKLDSWLFPINYTCIDADKVSPQI
jgi:hypothetical protein